VKRLRELFVRAGLQTSEAQWRLNADAAANDVATNSRQDAYGFDTLYECRTVSFTESVHEHKN